MQELEESCMKSAKKVAETIQKDDIIIFIWSNFVDRQEALANLLKVGLDTTSGVSHTFRACHIKRPHQQILLIGAPVIAYSDLLASGKTGFKAIVTQAAKIGAKLTAQLWVHDMSDNLYITGKPMGWNILNRMLLSGAVAMDQVTFLSTRWYLASSDETGSWVPQEKMKVTLRSEVEEGLLFEKLAESREAEVWRVIQRLIASCSGEERKKRKKRGEEMRKRREDEEKRAERVRALQREIEELYAELDKTEDGREIREKFVKADEDQRKYLVPIVTQLDDPNVDPAKKEKLEKKMAEEYHLSWREFRGHFDEVREMRIDIGRNIRNFYGLPGPKRKKLLGIL